MTISELLAKIYAPKRWSKNIERNMKEIKSIMNTEYKSRGVNTTEHIINLTDDLVSIDKLIQKIKKKCEEAVKTYDNEEFYEDEIETFLAEKNFAEEILEMIQEWED